ncbi:MAG: hypothetical protein OXC72_04530 [Roseovarius sp.]|nr:hypothetical protein [Roseovarius sp.]
MQVFDGNTTDYSLAVAQIGKLRARFGLSRMILAGCRGMLAKACFSDLVSIGRHMRLS